MAGECLLHVWSTIVFDLECVFGGKLAFRVLCSQAAWHSENSVLGKLAVKGLSGTFCQRVVAFAARQLQEKMTY